MPKAVLLPKSLQEKVASYPEYKMGVHRLSVVLRNGDLIRNVHIAWNEQVVLIEGQSDIPFSTEEIVDVVNSVF